MDEERASQSADKYIVRFPDGVREQLKSAAKANNRTLNAEIVARLQMTLNSAQTEITPEINSQLEMVIKNTVRSSIAAEFKKFHVALIDAFSQKTQ